MIPPDLAKVETWRTFHSNDEATDGAHSVRDPAPVRCRNLKLNCFPSSRSEVFSPIGKAKTLQISATISA